MAARPSAGSPSSAQKGWAAPAATEGCSSLPRWRPPDEGTPTPRFENNGLYAEFPAQHQGLRELTGRPEDLGKFKPPSLRNVALTAPYMHDGSLATLDVVLDHYARGGEPSATRSPLITGFRPSAEERRDLLAFLDSLTDEALLHDPRFADPW